MNNLNKDKVEQLIKEIKSEINDFKIENQFLSKFSNSVTDQEFLTYVNGIGGAYVKFLSLLVKKTQPKNIVELGNREGLSTLGIYQNLPSDAHFSTIDIDRDQRYCPKEMFSDKRVSFIFGDVCDVEIFEKLPKDIDILFSDTIHYNFQISDEFEIYQHLLADTALVAIDDIHTNDKGIFWDKLKYEKWDLTELCHHSGWGLFLYERKVQGVSIENRILEAARAAAVIWKRKSGERDIEINSYKERKLTSKIKKVIKKNKYLYKLGVYLINKTKR